MSSCFGKNFKMITFGESHGKAVGVVIDGIKPGIKVNEEDIQKELDKRKPGQSKITTQRKEDDKIEILSGIFEGKTTGTPICLVVYNKEFRSDDYSKIKDVFRPGHADFTFMKKYGIRDYRGGGRSSGRETVARVAAGAIAKKELMKKNIKITAYVKEVNGKKIKNKKEMEKIIMNVKKQNDSIGGIVECIVKNVPAGLGDPVFDKLDANIAKALMGIGAVKGVEIGSGFKSAKMKGSENNDQITKKGNKIVFKTNNAGGILGGISTGQDIVVRVAVKPTSSISKEQETIDVFGNKVKIKIEGRHDPCICPRIVPVVESMMALILYDAMLAQENLRKNDRFL